MLPFTGVMFDVNPSPLWKFLFNLRLFFKSDVPCQTSSVAEFPMTLNEVHGYSLEPNDRKYRIILYHIYL